jgi:hypothetical protein
VSDSYTVSSSLFPTPGGSGNNRTVGSVPGSRVGDLVTIGFAINKASSAITWNSVAGSVNPWQALIAPLVSPSSGAMTGWCMGIAFSITQTVTAGETVTFGFSSAPTGFVAGYQDCQCNNNPGDPTWTIDDVVGSFDTFNTTPASAVTLINPATQYTANEYCFMYTIVATGGYAGISGGVWTGNASGNFASIWNTEYGTPSQPGPTLTLGASTSLFGVGCTLFALGPFIPGVVNALGGTS